MRILHLVASIGRNSGGLGPVALGLSYAQKTLGCETTIWCLDSSTEVERVAGEWGDDVPIVTTPVFGPQSLGFSPVAERMADSNSGAYYDILHQHGTWMANSRVTNRWRAAFGRPTIVAPHGTLEKIALRRSAWKKKLALWAYEWRNLRLASCLHAGTKTEVTSFRNYGLRNPVAVIPTGIPDAWLDTDGDAGRFRSSYAIPQGKRILLYLSRLHPIKGLPLLFQAIASNRSALDDWMLVIAGADEGGHRRELEQLAAQLGITQWLRFVGPLFGQDKRDAFAAADLFVLPTHSEGFGIVIAEALGAGIPVLTTRGAPWEELETQRCGWWVDVSVDGLRQVLLQPLCLSKSELAEMGKRGKELVARKYTWAKTAEKTILLYEWLLGRGNRPDFVITD